MDFIYLPVFVFTGARKFATISQQNVSLFLLSHRFRSNTAAHNLNVRKDDNDMASILLEQSVKLTQYCAS
jgi:hypothetical protein